MQRNLFFTLILISVLFAQAVLAATPVSVALPPAEAGQPRTRCVSMAGADAPAWGMRLGVPVSVPSLFFTR